VSRTEGQIFVFDEGVAQMSPPRAVTVALRRAPDRTNSSVFGLFFFMAMVVAHMLGAT